MGNFTDLVYNFHSWENAYNIHRQRLLWQKWTSGIISISNLTILILYMQLYVIPPQTMNNLLASENLSPLTINFKICITIALITRGKEALFSIKMEPERRIEAENLLTVPFVAGAAFRWNFTWSAFRRVAAELEINSASEPTHKLFLYPALASDVMEGTLDHFTLGSESFSFTFRVWKLLIYF